MPSQISQYAQKTVSEVFRDFKTSEAGLNDKYAVRARIKYGLNEIRVKETSLWDIFYRQVNSPFFYLLFLCAVITLLIGEYIDSLLIVIFVLINVGISFFQESRATKVASLLKKYLPQKVKVKRNNKELSIDQKYLLPGDIVYLEAGNIIPADIRLIKTNSFIVDESVLSGESIPVTKSEQIDKKPPKEIIEAKNLVFASTNVIAGNAKGVVFATGQKTYFGEIAKLSAETQRSSIYEKDIYFFSKLIGRIVVLTIVGIFVLNLIIKGADNLLLFSVFCLTLIVGIIPEALPAVVTFAMSQSALKLAKKQVLVKRISAVEDLGNIDILCTDKTGTLTLNKMEMSEVVSIDPDKCILFSLLSSAYMVEEIESTVNYFDEAIYKKSKSSIKKRLQRYTHIAEIPFDTERSRNSALIKDRNNQKYLIVKGAPETILNLCTGFEGGISRSFIENKLKNKGDLGFRTLAIAYKETDQDRITIADENKLTFLGFFTFKDPLKKSAKKAIRLAQDLGVEVKILTGDSFEVANQVAQEINLIQNTSDVITSQYLNTLKEKDFEDACQKYKVFARVAPSTKYKIISALQNNNDVGFLGEGINDAPALKKANVSLVVKESAEISQKVADIILLRKDLKVIIEGIRQGRHIFANINKYIKCTIASNFGNFYSVAIVSLFITFLPILPVQILMINLLTDFPLIAVATDFVDQEELRKPKMFRLQNFIKLIMLLALCSTLFDFMFFAIFYRLGETQLQSLWFIESILSEILLIYSLRTRHVFFKSQKPSWTLIGLSLTAVFLAFWLPFSLIGQNYLHLTTPSLSALTIVIALLLGYFTTSEFVKLAYFRRYDLRMNGHKAK